MTSLESSIIKTISYFDIFDYPLTSWEIYTFLLREEEDNATKTNTSFVNVRHTLQTSKGIGSILKHHAGFYTLTGREALIEKRHERYVENTAKLKKARRAARAWALLPTTRLIAVCNNLAFLNAKRESDLDVFIVVKKGALPFARLLMVVVSILFFTRPTHQRQRDALCLSFIVDESSLSLTRFALSPRDVYLTYWAATLTPLYEAGGTYTMFRFQNRDILNNLPNSSSRKSDVLAVTAPPFLKRFFELLTIPFTWNPVSNFIFRSEVRMLPASISGTMNTSSAVVVTPSVFKTHLHDQRISIENAWKARYRAVALERT